MPTQQSPEALRALEELDSCVTTAYGEYFFPSECKEEKLRALRNATEAVISAMSTQKGGDTDASAHPKG